MPVSQKTLDNIRTKHTTIYCKIHFTLTDDDIEKVCEAVAANENIRWLDLSRNTQLTDVGIKKLVDNFPKMVSNLTLLGCNISDAGANYLSKLQLDSLDMQQNAISDTGVKYFFNHRSLKFFNFGTNKVSAEALKAVETSLTSKLG